MSGCIALAAVAAGSVRAAEPRSQSAGPASGTSQRVTATGARALLDQYCVTCHNGRTKTANLSLEGLDLASVGDHPESREKVVRKLRAGVMPPPDVKRPALSEYEALRAGCV